MTDIKMIRAAATRMEGHVQHTPLLSSPALDAIAGKRVLVKAECLQHTGSFKFRGGWSAISALSADQCANGVIAFSSGNHAQGVANAAAYHNAPATIIMPSDAPQVKIDNTRSLGAEVILYNRATDDRAVIAARHNPDQKMYLIEPYDNEYVIAGQGTVGLEIASAANTLGITDAQVITCCGGGGLTAGIALALEADAPNMQVRTAEPAEFDDVARSLATGTHQTNIRRSGSLCDAIITPSPGVLTFPIMQRLCGTGMVVTEDECLHAMALAFQHLRIVIEPGGAVALAACLFHAQDIENPYVIAVATGGNVDKTVFQTALSKFGDPS